jgi:virulence-associated protein VagC
VEVVVSRKGDSLTIRPIRLSMKELAAGLGAQPTPKMIKRSEVKAPRLQVNKSGD